ncbi:MAG: damage-inducible protein DinB, partial [Rhizobiaceae bacterium]|nr:damage-inducible protein DinB [Rhizobiaceae bacterium]
MHRFTGDVAAAPRLDGASYHDLGELRVERQAEDQRIVGWIDTLGDSTALAREISFSPVTQPGAVTLSLTTALANFFNHQTHHRGQCHMTLTALGKPSLAIDVIHFLRSEGKAWM